MGWNYLSIPTLYRASDYFLHVTVKFHLCYYKEPHITQLCIYSITAIFKLTAMWNILLGIFDNEYSTIALHVLRIHRTLMILICNELVQEFNCEHHSDIKVLCDIMFEISYRLFSWDVTTYLSIYFDRALAKSPFNFEHGLVITTLELNGSN